MGNIFRKESKKENKYINKIKDYDVDSNEVNNELTINNIVLVKCLKEIIQELEELQNKDNQRIHFTQPKLDMCNFSLL